MLKGEQLFEVAEKALKILKEDPKGLTMMELGSQGMHVPGVYRGPAKDYFESLGIIHTSIDLDGLSGSLKLDLTKPLTEFYNKYDIVTNFGTSEHVNAQFECFSNVHYFCKEGGVMVHSVPLPKNWVKHCKYHYPVKFFAELAVGCGYKVCESKTFNMVGGPNRGLVNIIFQKQNSDDFISKALFKKLPVSIGKFKKNHNNRF